MTSTLLIAAGVADAWGRPTQTSIEDLIPSVCPNGQPPKLDLE